MIYISFHFFGVAIVVLSYRVAGMAGTATSFSGADRGTKRASLILNLGSQMEINRWKVSAGESRHASV